MLTKAFGRQATTRHVHSLLSLFNIAPVNRIVLKNAAVHEAPLHVGVGYIVTRDIADFKKSDLPLYEPAGFAT